jgi:hypothetical protein
MVNFFSLGISRVQISQIHQPEKVKHLIADTAQWFYILFQLPLVWAILKEFSPHLHELFPLFLSARPLPRTITLRSKEQNSSSKVYQPECYSCKSLKSLRKNKQNILESRKFIILKANGIPYIQIFLPCSMKRNYKKNYPLHIKYSI